MNRAFATLMGIAAVLVWCGIASAQDKAPAPAMPKGTPMLVCDAPARVLEQGSGKVQVCRVVWVKTAKDASKAF